MHAEYFPDVIRQELASYLIEFAKAYVQVDDTLQSKQESEPDYSDPNILFQYQAKDVKPDPGVGVGVFELEPCLPPPPSPIPVVGDTSPVSNSPSSSPLAPGSSPRHSPCPISPVQSPVAAAVVAAPPRPLTPQPPLPVLRPEKVTVKSEAQADDEDEDERSFNNDEEEEEELMDV